MVDEQVEPTPERSRRGELVRVEVRMFDGLNQAHLDVRQTLLDRYWRDQLLLGEAQDYEVAAARHEAGQRLQMLYDGTGQRQRQMGVYGPRSRAYEEMTDEQAAAFEAYQAIVSRLTKTSPSVASAVVNLCIHEMDPVDRKDLIRGLDLLVKHWGMG